MTVGPDPLIFGQRVYLMRMVSKLGMVFIMCALRYAFATCVDAAGVGVYDLKLLMNHALSGDVTKVYVGSGEHLRRAQQKVTDYINGWMLPDQASKAAGMRTITEVGGKDIWSPEDIWRQREGGREMPIVIHDVHRNCTGPPCAYARFGGEASSLSFQKSRNYIKP